MARLCQADESTGANSIAKDQFNNGPPNLTDASLYLCPRPNDSQYLTECCFLDAKASCCERKHQDFIDGLDDRYNTIFLTLCCIQVYCLNANSTLFSNNV